MKKVFIIIFIAIFAGVVGAEVGCQCYVTLGYPVLGATGRFVQNQRSITILSEDFYNESAGLMFLNGSESFERGEFISYSLLWGTQERSEAGVLKEGEYFNLHPLLCYTSPPPSLVNPTHEIKEAITVNYSAMRWYESGLFNESAEKLEFVIGAGALVYSVDAGEIPMETMGESMDNATDLEYRGKMIFFGEEYYVKDIVGTSEVHAAKGGFLVVDDENYSAYRGYRFKINESINCGMLLDVIKPDESHLQVTVNSTQNALVDELEVAGFTVQNDSIVNGTIMVYNVSSNITLVNGSDLKMGETTKDGWGVLFETSLSQNADEINEYKSRLGYTLLERILISYEENITLDEGESFMFPDYYNASFDGFRTINYYTGSVFSGEGEGYIRIEKDEDYQLLISFTDFMGNRWDDIRLDQGPFARGDRFILTGNVYEYDDSEEQNDDVTMKITLKDLLYGMTETFDLEAYSAVSDLYLYTMAFEEASENDDFIHVEPDTIPADSDVFTGNIRGVPVLYNGGDLYFDVTGNGSIVGVSANQVGIIEDFELISNDLEIQVVNEDGAADQNDYGLPPSQKDYDDALILITNDDSEKIVVDLYDRDFNDAVDVNYSESVAAGLAGLPWNSTTGPPTVRLDNDVDTLLILPEGGTQLIVDWDADQRIDRVDILQPQEKVDATFFIGTYEGQSVLESVITPSDAGTTKTIGGTNVMILDFTVSLINSFGVGFNLISFPTQV